MIMGHCACLRGERPVLTSRKDQSPDATPEDFPWLLGTRVPCVDKHRVPRGTPVFEIDTATLSDHYLLFHHTLK